MPALRTSSAALVAAALLAACDSKSPSPSSCDGPVPVAIAGPDRTIARGTQVQLDGSAGATTETVSFVWRLEARPVGSGAVLSSATEARPTFTADAPGVYVASLTVSDACATSAPDVAVVIVPNAAPVAVAGSEQSVDPGAEVQLDGGGSADPDGDPLTFAWTLGARPTGSAASLSSASGQAVRFVPDAAGTYVALLVVSDGFTQSAPSAVTIRAGETSSLPGCAPAARPVAKAGADFTATSRYVNLSGAGSTSSRSAPLTYRWTLVTAPSGAGWMGSATTVNPTLYTEGSGSYVATLVVNDGCQDSLPDSVTITVPNHAPTASAYSPPIVPTRTSVTLDSSSYDQDGDPLTYAWKLESAPAGSVAALSRADVQRPTFVPDVDGSYVFSLVVRDSELASTPAALTITASNMKPVAKAGADQALPVGATVTLDASSSTDANGTPLTFAWTLARKPAGSAAAISTPDAAAATLVPDVEGVYVARLVASDGVQSASDDVTIAVWPAMQRLAHRVIDAEYSAALDRIIAVAADPNALRVIDPRTHAETTIALSMPPAAVSVSPDGLRAAVGHTNWISIVDLQTRAVETVAVIADVADLALAGNGWAYAVPRSPGTSEKARVVAVRLDTGVQTYATSNQTGIVRIKVRPGDSALYVAAASYSTVERFDITAGVPVLGGSVSAGYSYGGCGDLWLSEAGARIFTRCGSVYRASSAWSEDLSFAGSLRAGASGSASLLARHLSDSTEANEISAITRSDSTDYSYEDDEVLQRYEAASLGLLETAPFPSELVNGAPFPWRGRYVFYRSDGSERYVILQLDPASGALLDFGVATF